MGLIKAAVSAVKGTLADQWKEAIRCEDLSNDVLMVKKTTPTGVITNKSTIIVAPGQCAVIYDNGRVLDATAEDGFYTFDSSSSPSFFAGDFGATFKEMWQRFTYNGATAKEQAVFFFNTKEILDNKFGTTSPIDFQDWSHAIPNQMTNTLIPLTVQIMCHGKYTFKISDPALFMQEMSGTAAIYRKDMVVEQIRAEVISVLQNVANELGSEEYKVPAAQMQSYTDEIREMMDEKVFDEPIRRRGLSIVSFAIEKATLTDASRESIQKYELSANAHMQQGKMVDSYAEAVKEAAKNKGGAINGFMGIGMMNMATNGMMGGVAAAPWQNTEKSEMNLNQSKQEVKDTPTTLDNEWTCECGTKNTGKFCSNCGKPKASDKKECPKCKTMNNANDKFCSECGTKLD